MSTWGHARTILAGLVITSAVGLPGSPAAGSVSGILPGSGGYARVIRLAHAGELNGVLIETDTEEFISGTQRFFRSADDGESFDQLPSLTVTGNIHGSALFELPADAGTMPAGTLLLAMAVNPRKQYQRSGGSRMRIPVYRSDDHAQSWTLLSYCTRTDLPGTRGGLWEPELHVADDGSLVCLFSDESDQPAHSQVLTQVVSGDGGATWGEPEQVVADPDPQSRPGMATTVKIGDGAWIMTYEACGPPACVVRFRRGTDGLRWGPPGTDGTVPSTAAGASLISSPYVAWSPSGGPKGTIVIGGKTFTDGLTAGTTLLANTNAGAGPWTPIPAPFNLPPKPVNTLADAIENLTNYSSPLLALPDGDLLGFSAHQPEARDPQRVYYGITALPLVPQNPPVTTTTTPPPAPPPSATSTSPADPGPVVPAPPAVPVDAAATYTG